MIARCSVGLCTCMSVACCPDIDTTGGWTTHWGFLSTREMRWVVVRRSRDSSVAPFFFVGATKTGSRRVALLPSAPPPLHPGSQNLDKRTAQGKAGEGNEDALPRVYVREYQCVLVGVRVCSTVHMRRCCHGNNCCQRHRGPDGTQECLRG